MRMGIHRILEMTGGADRPKNGIFQQIQLLICVVVGSEILSP